MFFLWFRAASLCTIHLNRIYSVAEYFLQNGQVVSVHGGNFSLFELGGEPGWGDTEDWVKTSANMGELFLRRAGKKPHLPARPAICRAWDVLMVSMCFSPLSLMVGFMRLLKMILFILLGHRKGTELEGWMAPIGKGTTVCRATLTG